MSNAFVTKDSSKFVKDRESLSAVGQASKFFIVLRNPFNDKLVAVETGDGDRPSIMTWPSKDDAIKASKDIWVC